MGALPPDPIGRPRCESLTTPSRAQPRKRGASAESKSARSPGARHGGELHVDRVWLRARRGVSRDRRCAARAPYEGARRQAPDPAEPISRIGCACGAPTKAYSARWATQARRNHPHESAMSLKTHAVIRESTAALRCSRDWRTPGLRPASCFVSSQVADDDAWFRARSGRPRRAPCELHHPVRSYSCRIRQGDVLLILRTVAEENVNDRDQHRSRR